MVEAKKGATRKEWLKVENFKETSKELQEKVINLEKDVLRVGRAKGGKADEPRDKRKPRGPK